MKLSPKVTCHHLITYSILLSELGHISETEIPPGVSYRSHFVPLSVNLLYYCCHLWQTKCQEQTVLLARPGMLLDFGEKMDKVQYFLMKFASLMNTILSICNKSTELRHCHNSENPIKSVTFTEIV